MYLFQKTERSGVVALLLIIVVLQVIFWGGNRLFNTETEPMQMETEIVKFQHEIDSLKRVKLMASKPKIYPFNPNFLTDYRAYTLGLPTEAYDKLMAFRKQDKFVNSALEFQKVTGISDSLLLVISPYFKFPDWVNNSQSNTQFEKNTTSTSQTNTKQPKIDINLATKEQLMAVYGVGDKLSEKIIKYRTKLQGYSFDNQLYEVWGLEKEVADKVLQQFGVLSKPVIEKKNINDLTFKELLHTPYMDYELTKKIFNLKNAAGKITDMDMVKKIDGFPIDKFEKISVYLKAD
jgi:DNA uptake protein ComE-like DNA-binding protein